MSRAQGRGLARTHARAAEPAARRGRSEFGAHCSGRHPRHRDAAGDAAAGGGAVHRRLCANAGQIPLEKVPGDPAKGAEVFSTKGACLSCHTRDGQGVAFGPDLTNIGQRRSVAFLRRSLVEPAADVPQSFEPYRADVSLPLNFSYIRAKTKAGKEYAGIRVNEDTYSIQFRDVTGEIHSFYKKELAELKKDQASPMPVYGALLAPAELDDVLAYLVSLRGKKT